MGNILERNMMIGPSMTDASGRLSFANCFDLFMDIATVHSIELGIGPDTLGPKNLYWVTAKSKIRFYRRPMVTEVVQISTWAESRAMKRCLRDYRLAKGTEVLAEGRTQWCVMDMVRGTVVDLEDLYPEKYNVQDETFRLEPFARLSQDFPEEPFARYTISANDIDMGRHMNNVAYVRAFQNAFSTKEWKALNPAELEIQFISSCFEGETLEFRKRQEGRILFVRGSVGDRTAVLLRVELCPEKCGKNEKPGRLS